MSRSLDFKYSVFSLTEWLSCSTFSSRPDACSSLDPSISEPFLWASYLIAWMFHFALYSFWLIFNDSIALLNFILMSWITFIIILYNITYSTLCFCGSYSDIHILIEFLECIYYCYFEIIVLSVTCVAFLRDHFYGSFWRKFLILGGDILSSLYLRCLCFCDGT